MKKLLIMTVVLLGLSACNTIQGIGKDVKRAGEVVENAGRK
ncbi:MAG: entericidin A/B family lipoprotein [Burkholderiales bacterium]|nr:entericidin A/B family lipoprotein [Burkholderiales bacterium]